MNHHLRRLWVVAYCLLIFYGSSLQFPKGLPGFKGMDLIEHFVEYGILAFLFYRMAVIESVRYLKSYPFLSAVIFCSLYGVSDELHQWWVPTRYTSALDWLMDTLGAVMVLGVIRWFLGEQRLKEK